MKKKLDTLKKKEKARSRNEGIQSKGKIRQQTRRYIRRARQMKVKTYSRRT